MAGSAFACARLALRIAARAADSIPGDFLAAHLEGIRAAGIAACVRGGVDPERLAVTLMAHEAPSILGVPGSFGLCIRRGERSRRVAGILSAQAAAGIHVIVLAVQLLLQIQSRTVQGIAVGTNGRKVTFLLFLRDQNVRRSRLLRCD
jgi:hypothetical protein